MTLQGIAKYRSRAQQLTETKLESPVEMVEWFAAIQGQEYHQTKWALALRLPHLTDNDIEDELNNGKILRTHLLRPTWHFVSAKDVHWLLDLTAPRVQQSNAYMYRKLELDNKIFNRCNRIMTKLLQGERHLHRDEINKAFEKQGIIANGHRLSYIMMNAELNGILCSGRRQGNQFTYALLEERVVDKNKLEKDEALSELTSRYFKSRGPATIHDFANWSGLTKTTCKKGIDMAINHLQQEVVEGYEYFFNPQSPPPSRPFQKVCLLPIYDEFIMGYKDRSALLTSKGDGHLKHDCMMVYNGQVIGTWKRTLSKNSINLEYDLFKPLKRFQQKALNEALKNFGKFVNLELNRTMTIQRGI